MTNISYLITNVYEILTWLINKIIKYKKVEVRIIAKRIVQHFCHEYVSHWRELLLLHECDVCIVIFFLVLSRKKVYLFKKLIIFVETMNFRNFSSKLTFFERIAKVCLNWKNDNKFLSCVSESCQMFLIWKRWLRSRCNKKTMENKLKI